MLFPAVGKGYARVNANQLAQVSVCINSAFVTKMVPVTVDLTFPQCNCLNVSQARCTLHTYKRLDVLLPYRIRIAFFDTTVVGHSKVPDPH